VSESLKIYSTDTREVAVALLMNLDLSKKWEVTIKPLDKRTIDQNALQHKHYAEIGKFHGYTPGEAKNFCKYTYAMPILIRDDPDLFAYFELVLSGLEYEQRLLAMEHIDVTSLFSKKQASEYTDTIYQQQGALGVQLTIPEQ